MQRPYEALGVSNTSQGAQFECEAFGTFNVRMAFAMVELRNNATGCGMDVGHGHLLNIDVEGAGYASSNDVQKAHTTCRYGVILDLTNNCCTCTLLAHGMHSFGLGVFGLKRMRQACVQQHAHPQYMLELL